MCLVVVGDHGEGFWEHATFDAAHFADPRPAYCVGHGGTPYEVVTRVPLCVSGFSTATERETDTLTGGADQTTVVSLVDVAPSLLDRVGLARTHETDGVSLLSTVPANRRVLVEGTRYGYEKKAVYGAGWKLIVSRGDDFRGGFSLPAGDRCDLPADIESSLSAALPPWPDDSDGGLPEEHATVSNDAQRRLDRLDYR